MLEQASGRYPAPARLSDEQVGEVGLDLPVAEQLGEAQDFATPRPRPRPRRRWSHPEPSAPGGPDRGRQRTTSIPRRCTTRECRRDGCGRRRSTSEHVPILSSPPGACPASPRHVRSGGPGSIRRPRPPPRSAIPAARSSSSPPSGRHQLRAGGQWTTGRHRKGQRGVARQIGRQCAPGGRQLGAILHERREDGQRRRNKSSTSRKTSSSRIRHRSPHGAGRGECVRSAMSRPSRILSRTSWPILSGYCSMSCRLPAQASETTNAGPAAVALLHSGDGEVDDLPTGCVERPVERSIDDRVAFDAEPADAMRWARGHSKARLEQLHAHHEAGDVSRHWTDRVEDWAPAATPPRARPYPRWS